MAKRRVGRLRRALLRWFIGALAVLVGLAALFQLVYRPWQRNWGATAEEVGRRMPGDEIISEPQFNATRAVTIRGQPDEIWPWLVQIGYGRAGFYSYDRLDNDGVPSAEAILAEYQDLEVGDEIPLSNVSGARVAALEPDRFLVMTVGRDPDRPGAFTWVFGLYPEGREETRLVSRLRWRAPGSFSLMLIEAVEIWMMRKCLLGIKRRVEASTGRELGGAWRERPGGRPAAAPRAFSSARLPGIEVERVAAAGVTGTSLRTGAQLRLAGAWPLYVDARNLNLSQCLFGGKGWCDL